MVNDEFVEFPAVSVAVYVTVVTPTGNVLPELWVDENDVTPTLSVAVGVSQVATLPVETSEFIVMLEGIPEITGDVVSITGAGTSRDCNAP